MSNTVKGSPSGLQELIKNMQNGFRTSSPVDVDLTKLAVYQLWGNVQGIISFGTSLMRPILKVFGLKVGNDLSLFALDIKRPWFVEEICVIGLSV